MYNFSFHDRQHLQKMLANEQVIAGIFDEFILSVSPQLKKWANTSNVNIWIGNAGVEKFVESKLVNLHSDLLGVINHFQMDAWKRSNLKNDEFIRQYIEDMAISETVKHGLFAQNLDVLKQFQQRKENGMNLSQKVWNLASQTKTQLEFYLESGLSVGRSAATISQDVRQILNNPDKKFHRIRDKKGNLVLSQPMKDYHPGTGQYRSSAMNALRLTATETNMMYRKADSVRWEQMDFVLGFRVERSGSNDGPCKICDPLVGDYPKGFTYSGWHPFCICPATPVLLEPEEFAEYLHTGELPVDKLITDLPGGMMDYLKENESKFKTIPYWIKDNFIDGDISKGVSFKLPTIAKAEIISVKTDPLQKAILKAEKQIKQASKLDSSSLSSLVEALNNGINGKDLEALKIASKAMAKAIKEQKALKSFKQPTRKELEKAFGKPNTDALLASFNKHLAKKNTSSLPEYVNYLEYEIKWIKEKTLHKYPTAPKLMEMLEQEMAAVKYQLTLAEAKELQVAIADTKQLIKANKKVKSDLFAKLAGKFKETVEKGADLATIKQLNTDIANEIQHIQLLKSLKKSKFKPGKYSLAQFYTPDELAIVQKLENDLQVELLKPSHLKSDSRITDLSRELSDKRKELAIKYRLKMPDIKHLDNLSDVEYKKLCDYLQEEIDILNNVPRNELYRHVPDVELAALRRYTGSYYDALNTYLRGESPHSSRAKEYDAFKIIANRALEKMPRFEGMCWRGAYVDDSVVEAIKKCMDTGISWEYPAFQSSSRIKGANFSGNVIFGIKSKAGAILEDISHYQNEKEVLFRAGSQFKVVKVERRSSGGNWYIELEEIL